MSYGSTVVRKLVWLTAGCVVVSVSAGLLLSIKSSEEAYRSASRTDTGITDPFPIGVDPQRATITEQMLVQDFYQEHLAAADQANTSWLNRLANELQSNGVFQQLASSVTRVFVVWPGERTEEVTENIGDVMRWNATDRATFSQLMDDNQYSFSQGFVVPGQYISHRYATPEEISGLLHTEFTQEIESRYSDEAAALVPLDEALIIASLIEREASDFANMREISGVIWNRLFIDMPLQLDASLQYVKAENPYEPSWWPAVRPADKFMDSPYNTYQNTGLPPAPIANPSVAAVVAALNPRITDCLYYFHSRTRDYYCSVTYEEHVSKLREVYNLSD